ncbi:hypothetical protein WJX72_009516 [[Myrmecia] bisecta]|uniref:Uncharacterized protein n=1 Tax=[Myrmecia] bisecta TaxID=41462 RepID=A0AAW1PIB3_9CHLO
MPAHSWQWLFLSVVIGQWLPATQGAPVYTGSRVLSPPVTPQGIRLFNNSCVIQSHNVTLDHNKGSGDTFQLYNFVCDGLWRKPANGQAGGPIFLWSGSRRGTLRDAGAYRGLFEYAAEHEALVVFADRRYFGWSLPDEYFRDGSITYLTYEQTVQDDAQLVQLIRKQYGAQQSPAIIFTATSKLGVLARLLQPDVFAGVVASSAVLLGYPGQEPTVDAEMPYKIVTKAANDANPNCAANIHTALVALTSGGNATSLPGASALTVQVNRIQQLKTDCHGTSVVGNNTLDELVAWTEAVIEHLAEEDGRMLAPSATNTVHDLGHFCNTFFADANQTPSTALQSLADALSYEFGSNLACNQLTFGNNLLPEMDEASNFMFVDLTAVASSYLDCSGEGLNAHYMKQSTGVDDMFVPHLEAGIDSFEKRCRERFPGLAMDEAWGARILGPNITAVLRNSSNMVFINGAHDANSAASVTWNVSDSIFALSLPLGAATDFYDTAVDLPVLRPLRAFVNTQIRRWVAAVQPTNSTAPGPAPSTSPRSASGRKLQQSASVPCPDCRCLPKRTPTCRSCFREDADGVKCYDNSGGEYPDDDYPADGICAQCLVIFR